ncbi:hypothetical protein PHMEG_0003049 [Phytophthora megakarya]|uniref:Uncharacterized protein n=1 Tax=Phytophthora megakarya TaxID=4795 RepID=A0A225WZE5_9STRA|nr:hypothetical protein PHMEG_0003049 [Phytophthora megakarya]
MRRLALESTLKSIACSIEYLDQLESNIIQHALFSASWGPTCQCLVRAHRTHAKEDHRVAKILSGMTQKHASRLPSLDLFNSAR